MTTCKPGEWERAGEILYQELIEKLQTALKNKFPELEFIFIWTKNSVQVTWNPSTGYFPARYLDEICPFIDEFFRDKGIELNAYMDRIQIF